MAVMTFPGVYTLMDNVLVEGDVSESLLHRAFTRVLQGGSVRLYAKNHDSGSEKWVDLSAAAGSAGANDTPIFGSTADMSARDEAFLSDDTPLVAFYAKTGTAGAYVGDGIEVYDSTDGLTASRLLSGLQDGSNGFRNSGWRRVTWTAPASAAQKFALSPSSSNSDLNTPRYWYRIQLKNFSSVTTAPLLDKIILQLQVASQQYTDDTTLVNGSLTAAPTVSDVFPIEGGETVYAIDEKNYALVIYSFRRGPADPTGKWQYYGPVGAWRDFTSLTDESNGFKNGPAAITTPPNAFEVNYSFPSDWVQQSITFPTAGGNVVVANKYFLRYTVTAVTTYNESPSHLVRSRVLQYGAANVSGGFAVQVGATLKGACLSFHGPVSGSGDRYLDVVNLNTGDKREIRIPGGTTQGSRLAVAFSELAIPAGGVLGLIVRNGGAVFTSVAIALEQ